MNTTRKTIRISLNLSNGENIESDAITVSTASSDDEVATMTEVIGLLRDIPNTREGEMFPMSVGGGRLWVNPAHIMTAQILNQYAPDH